MEASNVKITESASGKTTKFYLTGRDEKIGTDKIRFAPVKGAKKEVLLEMDPFGDPLSTVKGSYTVAGKTVPFTLTKKEEAPNGSTADSNSTNAVSFSSARTTKRFRVALRLCRATTILHHFYEARPARKDHREVDLISDALPFGCLW